MGLFKTWTEFKVTSWNVRTPGESYLLPLNIAELHRYNICVACLWEARIPDLDSYFMKVLGHDIKYQLLHSCPTEKSALYGVPLDFIPAVPKG